MRGASWIIIGAMACAAALACNKSNHPAPAPASTPRVAPPAAGTAASPTARPTINPLAGEAATSAVEPDGSALPPDRRDHMVAVRKQLKEKLGPTYTAPIPAVDAARLQDGADIFSVRCSSCHGATGHGDGNMASMFNPPPVDLTNPAMSTFYSDAGVLEIIRNGISGGGMVGWGTQLTDTELLDVFNYVRSLHEQK